MHSTQPHFEEPVTADRPFEWQKYYHAIVDRLWIIAICVILGGVAAFLQLRGKETIYAARSVLFIEQQRTQILDASVAAVRDEQIKSIDMINTIVDFLRGIPFARSVVERYGLNKDPDFLASSGATSGEIPVDAAAAALTNMVSANYRENTRLIDITVRNTYADVATALANAYAEQYLRLKLEETSEITKSAAQHLVEEAKRLGDAMRESEEKMQSFREREKAASLETMLATTEEDVAALTTRLREEREKLGLLDRDLTVAEANPDDAILLLQLPAVLADPKVGESTATINLIEQELVLVNERYRAEHPIVLNTLKRLELAKQDQAAALDDIIGRLKGQREIFVAQIDKLDAQLIAAQSRLLELTGMSVEYNSLARNLEQDRTFYTAVLERLREVDLTSGIKEQAVTIHERALGANPIPPKTLRTYLMGLIGGLVAGIAIAIGLQRLDPSIHTIEQAERITGLKVVSAIPQLNDKETGLVTLRDRHGLSAEAFRTLRASIAMLDENDNRQIFLFTSAVPSEGKTFTSANFAVTLTQQDYRTLYIDADLRKPAVSKLLFNDHLTPGLVDILTRKCSVDEAIRSTEIPNLDVITAGSRSENPAELLALRHVKDLMSELRQRYDRIVIDSAPIIAVSDTLLIAGLADVNCLILRAQSTPRKSVIHAVRLLTDLGCPPAGVVFNRVRLGFGSYYYYYHSYSHEPYGHPA